MKRWDVINHLAQTYNLKRYLEIGVCGLRTKPPHDVLPLRKVGATFKRVICPVKDGVDPAGAPANYVVTSDEFFDCIPDDQMYDLVFIDGQHIREQVHRDFASSLAHLNPGGYIVLHDCNPRDETYNGTVWQFIVDIRCTRDDLYVVVVDTDWGCGVIRRGHQKLLEDGTEDYDYFNEHRKELLNLITVEEFINETTGRS